MHKSRALINTIALHKTSSAICKAAVGYSTCRRAESLPIFRSPAFELGHSLNTHTATQRLQVQPHRTIVTAAEVLRRKRTSDVDYVIQESVPISSAVSRLGDRGKVHALVVVADADKHVIGLVTARDVLRAIDKHNGDINQPVSVAMTPADRVVHIRPDDNITQAALLMSELKIGHLPVIQDGEVQGVVSLQDIADVTLEPARGGKDAVVRRVLPRRGISKHTKIASAAQHALQMRANHKPLFLKTGDAALPRAQREEKPIEDAHFISHVWWPGLGSLGNASGPLGHTMTYIGVADGVGSWHQFDVDPRLYAQRLMSAAAEYIWKRASTGATPPSTHDVLNAAWETVSSEKVIGSCTACILSVDCTENQLSFTGLGDCGFVLLRDTDINRVGTLLRGGTASGIRPGWRVSARATQQLRGFNMPYQLGYAPGHEDKFEKPWQGETLVLPVHSEDVILVGTDGLFDNMDETDIVGEVEKWDKLDLERRLHRDTAKQTTHYSPESMSDAKPRLMNGSSVGMDMLAKQLAHRARELSLDRMRDGPFARLAKENDVLWTKGGRPDDITVVAGRISPMESITPVD